MAERTGARSPCKLMKRRQFLPGSSPCAPKTPPKACGSWQLSAKSVDGAAPEGGHEARPPGKITQHRPFGPYAEARRSCVWDARFAGSNPFFGIACIH